MRLLDFYIIWRGDMLFAGTIQALIPLNRAEEYTKLMDSIFGDKSAIKIKVRQSPVCEV